MTTRRLTILVASCIYTILLTALYKYVHRHIIKECCNELQFMSLPIAANSSHPYLFPSVPTQSKHLLLQPYMILDRRTRLMVTTRFFALVARNNAITSGADIPVISLPSISVRTSPSWIPRILACPLTLATKGPRADELTLIPSGPGC